MVDVALRMKFSPVNRLCGSSGLALRRPYTFVVMAVLIAILGGAAIWTMAVDIFPYIDIPIVSIVWQYSGLSPEEMEGRIVTNFERALTSNVVGIEHIESQSYQSIAAVRVYFHPNVPIDLALAQIVTQCQVVVRNMPPGTFPPQVLKYDAASVPILQLGLSSKTLQEQEIFDLGNNFIRTPLATVQGANVSYPFGGKSPQILVDLNTDELYAKQLSPIDISNALSLQNLILPAGTAKLGQTEYPIRLNSSPSVISEFNDLPIKTVNGATVYMKDVATVHSGFSPQQNLVRTNGSRGVLLTVTRNGNASTLDIVTAVRNALPKVMSTITQDVQLSMFGDQSIFVRSAIKGVLREALIAAFLTGTVILLFLGSWQSTLIVWISIPLSILTSICFLSLLGADHQRDDAGRLRPGGGHPGRRRHGGNREYASQPGNAQAAGARGLGRSIADRCADAGLDSLDLHRICSRAAADRDREVFVHAAGDGRSVRDARVIAYLSRTLVPTMVHHMLQGEAKLYQSGVARRQGEFCGPCTGGSTICLSASATAMWDCSIFRCGIAGRCCWHFW